MSIELPAEPLTREERAEIELFIVMAREIGAASLFIEEVTY